MKVLVTGHTRLQCGQPPQLRYLSNAELFVDALRFGGVEVDFRKVEIGEDLSAYDAVFLGMAPPLSITADRTLSVLDVLGRSKKESIPIVFYLDDWCFSRTTNQYGTIYRTGTYQLTKEFFSTRYDYQWGVENTDVWNPVVTRIFTETWPTCVVPAFTWGDHARLLKDVPSEKIVCLDPSTLSDIRYPDTVMTVPEAKKRQWVLSALIDERKWLDKIGVGWPVDHVGGVASKAPRRLKEVDLMQLYADSWGVMSAPHIRVIGTGWWRFRFAAAVKYGNIMLADPREAGPLGEAYDVKPAEVERYGTWQLAALAQRQADAFRAQSQPVELVTETLIKLMKEAKPW